MDWINCETQQPTTSNSYRRDRTIIYQSEPVLCAIKAETKDGVRYIVKEGKYEKRFRDGKCIWDYWRIAGSQNNVVAWMPLPEYKEE